MKRKTIVTLILTVFLVNILLPTISNISYAEETKEENVQTLSVEKAQEQIIKDGIYRTSMHGNDYCHMSLEIENGSKQVEANVQIGTWINKNNDKNKFKIVYDETSGYYTIQSVISGNMLDVQNGGMTSGTNVWQHGSNGTDAQKWTIRHNSKDDTYSIISKKNGLYLDIQDGNMSNGTNIRVYTGNNSNAQKFKLVKQENKSIKYLENDRYKILTKLKETTGFDMESASKTDGGILQIWNYEKAKQQQFEMKYQNGYYYIINRNSGKALQANGKSIKQYSLDYSNDNQKWELRLVDNKYYSIISKASGLCINVPDAKATNGTDLQLNSNTYANSQLFNILEMEKIQFQTGYYGSSGLKVKGDSRGSSLKYYKIGSGPNVLFATFSVHGFEDGWNNDGQELTKIAEKFKAELLDMQDYGLADKWTIYILPSVNPDGAYYGYTKDGPGRTSLYSSAPGNKGIDINRGWSTGYRSVTGDRNYNGTAPFQSYEAVALRDFMLSKRATRGQTVVVDLHGWLNETMGDNGIGSYYRNQFGMTKHIETYGMGYLINWARTNLGYNGRTARAALVELPEVANSNEVISNKYSEKYINATLKMLRDM